MAFRGSIAKGHAPRLPPVHERQLDPKSELSRERNFNHSPTLMTNSPTKPPIVFTELPYQPRGPRAYRPAIGLIGCGGITKYHLMAYHNAGFHVAALCDVDIERARERGDEFFPDAAVYSEHRQLLRRDDIEVVDIATHPPIRPALIQNAIRAGKHVLSQKPFVLDLDVGRSLVDLADQHGVKLAVNQNARWAPHYSFIRSAIEAGWLGDVFSVHLSVHWDHSWVRGTPFEHIDDLILYDYAIHWFDLVTCFLPERTPTRVYASRATAPHQPVAPPLLAQAMIEFEDAQASLAFDGFVRQGPQDRSFVAGTEGTAFSIGPGNREQTLTIHRGRESFQPQLTGCWFPDGFQGTMGELLCSIEEDRVPSIDARRNLNSLALCFAAVHSARIHEPVAPGNVNSIERFSK
jgi:predicted dehydrogenase